MVRFPSSLHTCSFSHNNSTDRTLTRNTIHTDGKEENGLEDADFSDDDETDIADKGDV